MISKNMKIIKYSGCLLAIFLSQNLTDIYRPKYLATSARLENILDKTDRKIRDVPLSELQGAYGVFISHENIKVGRELQEEFKEYVRQHELAHASGVDGTPRGEYLADIIAASKTGKARYIRGPFYQPPVK